ncbi:hypothetical protein GQX74_014721 [Glossina fuscipes]|nr:hypothetical protein GQX74_014721 [Glossina fuscipes]
MLPIEQSQKYQHQQHQQQQHDNFLTKKNHKNQCNKPKIIMPQLNSSSSSNGSSSSSSSSNNSNNNNNNNNNKRHMTTSLNVNQQPQPANTIINGLTHKNSMIFSDCINQTKSSASAPLKRTAALKDFNDILENKSRTDITTSIVLPPANPSNGENVSFMTSDQPSYASNQKYGSNTVNDKLNTLDNLDFALNLSDLPLDDDYDGDPYFVLQEYLERVKAYISSYHKVEHALDICHLSHYVMIETSEA